VNSDAKDLLVKLINCKSVTPNDDGALSVIENALNANNFKCERLIFGSGDEKVQNLFARLGNKSPHICFAGHSDVVPEGDIKHWEFSPFDGEISDRKIFGRGAVDMKGSIASYLSAAIDWIKKNKSFDGSISFLITGDEEGPAINGTRKVLEWMEANGQIPDMCVVGEPTNTTKVGDTIKIGRRGSLNGNLTVYGEQGHVAYPHLALNPFPILMKMLEPLLEGELDKGTKNFPPTNASITSIDTGNNAVNVIPSSVKAKFNIRFNDSQDKEKLESFLKSHFDEVYKNYEIEFSCNAEPFLTKPGKLIDIIKSAIFKKTNILADLSTTGGTSDARFISQFCPVVEFGLVGKTMHQINENVLIDDLNLLSEIYYEFLNEIFLAN
jgi:succinyl-diaminopimelate desuccinylase